MLKFLIAAGSIIVAVLIIFWCASEFLDSRAQRPINLGSLSDGHLLFLRKSGVCFGNLDGWEWHDIYWNPRGTQDFRKIRSRLLPCYVRFRLPLYVDHSTSVMVKGLDGIWRGPIADQVNEWITPFERPFRAWPWCMTSAGLVYTTSSGIVLQNDQDHRFYRESFGGILAPFSGCSDDELLFQRQATDGYELVSMSVPSGEVRAVFSSNQRFSVQSDWPSKAAVVSMNNDFVVIIGGQTGRFPREGSKPIPIPLGQILLQDLPGNEVALLAPASLEEINRITMKGEIAHVLPIGMK